MAVAAPPQDRFSFLLTEGSSTSARHTLYALGRAGHLIDVCDPQRLCLGRFSRFVRAWHRCPSYTADPLGYLRFLIDRLNRQKYDVLLPVHDQVYLLSRFRETLGRHVGLAVPEFEAVEQVQDKANFSRLLDIVGLPQPPTTVVTGIENIEGSCEFPCYIKLAIGTAGRGVWLVHDVENAQQVIQTLRTMHNEWCDGEFILQQPALGVFHVVQCVFRHGELVAAHCYKGTATGVGGSAHGRESVTHKFVWEDAARLGAHLNWHGAMHLEFFYDSSSGRRAYFEANPRIGETLNATLCGTNLCEYLARVSLELAVKKQMTSRVGVRTRSLLMGVMGAADRGEGRAGVIRELFHAWTGRGAYRDSQDELTRPREDALSVIPATAVTLPLVFCPGLAGRMIRGTVANYSLNSEAARRIRALPKETLPPGAPSAPNRYRWSE